MEPLLHLEVGDLVEESGYGMTIYARVTEKPVLTENNQVSFKAEHTESGKEISYLAGGTYGSSVKPKNIIQYKHGDVFEHYMKHDIFIHQANCFNTIKTGVGAGVRKNMPELIQADNLTLKGDIRKLGTFSTATINNTICFNLYGQYTFDREKQVTDYDAIIKALKAINILYRGKDICMPMIGSGLGGGNWEVISRLINIYLKNCQVTVYQYTGA